MATDVLSLFNMPTQEQLGRSYLEGMLTSPQQMGAQSLLQQVVSLGGNAGAGIGYGVGRLMGGMTADEVRAKSIDDAMRTVQGMGFGTDAEMYGALSQELARRGLTQDALMARNAGLKAAQAEQSMETERQRLGLSQQELVIRQEAAQREAELAPLKLEALKLDITNKREEQKTTEEQLAEALKQGNTARAEGLQRRLDAYKNEIAFKERELKVRERQAGAAEMQAQAAASRAEAIGNQESFSQNVTVRDLMNNPVPIGRYSTKLNEFMANDGTRFKTRTELEAYVKQQSPAATAVTPKGGTANWQAFLPQQPKQ
jgi:hypothetical protein